MSHYYLDSSAVIKRYVVEVGTPWIRELTAPNSGNVILIAQLTQVEVVSAAMRRQREGAIALRTAQAIRLLMNRHANREYQVVGLTDDVTHRAEDLLEHYSLRAYDAIQLASALESQARLAAASLPGLTFISADGQLLRVAQQVGLASEDPLSRD